MSGTLTGEEQAGVRASRGARLNGTRRWINNPSGPRSTPEKDFSRNSPVMVKRLSGNHDTVPDDAVDDRWESAGAYQQQPFSAQRQVRRLVDEEAEQRQAPFRQRVTPATASGREQGTRVCMLQSRRGYLAGAGRGSGVSV